MKKLWLISPRKIALGFGAWFVATNLLVLLSHVTNWWPPKALLFACLVFLPGAALLRILQLSRTSFITDVLYSFGLSILVLMLSGLAANEVLPLLGVSRPLVLLGALGAWDAIVALLIGIGIWINRQPILLNFSPLKKFTKPAWLLFGASLLLPILAIFGAFRINNGGDALVAMTTLCFAAALIIYAFLLRHKLPDGLLAWLIFILSLTILLMTSLRGWDIVGHDIAREVRVYTLTDLRAKWDITQNHDPYSACLSITILPEMFTRLMGVSGLLVFKVILQVVFAACPVVVFVLLRKYASKLGALVGSILFICYPTFINDSAMLTRQGVAYLFFALALLILVNKTQTKRHKALFLMCSLGAILSHYSTAYMFVGLFAVAVGFKVCIRIWQYKKRRARGEPPKPKTVVSPLYAGLLFLMTFVWYTQITATSEGLFVTLRTSFANIPSLFTSDNKSSDTSTALFFAGGKSQIDLYESYLMRANIQAAFANATAGQFAPILTSDELPLTELGKKARQIGIDPLLISVMRQNFAKLLQVLAGAGVLFATYHLLRKRTHALPLDFICLSWAGIVLLTLIVILPTISINYGVLRAFQQALIFLVLPMTILLVHIGRLMWPRIRITVATSCAVFLFLLFTGWFAQMLGGNSPSMSMNNSGLYYGLYASSEADSRAFRWLKRNSPRGSDVRAANFNRAFMHDPSFPFAKPGVLPFQVGPKTYTYLDPAQVQTQKIYTYHESSPLIMTFPLGYFEAAKDEIYSTTSTRIYR